MAGATQHQFWGDDDHDDVVGDTNCDDAANLDFLAVDHDGGGDSTDLDFFAVDYDGCEEPDFDLPSPCAEPESDDTGSDLDAICPPNEPDDDGPEVPTYTVTNPAGTVSVSALMDGSIHRVELSPKLTDCSESELEEEILALADLARLHGRSAQRTFILNTMSEGDRNNEIVLEMLNQHLDLPTPEEAAAAEADVFARRYAHDEE